ncbi:MAG TPA: SBBP repeat-containing protein [Bryobacteraceae bacterium]|nr:SBBP repeat-containing protein [Bryobacteraceae bacterium]
MRLQCVLLLLAVASGLAGQTERSLPVFFYPNIGQTDASIRYLVDTPELRAGFMANAATFRVHGAEVRVRFAGANPMVAIEAGEPLAARVNLFLGGDPRHWKPDLPTYHKILYRGLYPGIDMTYAASAQRLKSEFLVAPGADPEVIRLEYSGAERLSIDANGDLVVRGSKVELREEAPELYQRIGGKKRRVEGRYLLIDAHTIGFSIGPYDPTRELVIDPVISYCTFLGGSAISAVTGVALDSAGNLYVAGWTEALDFPIAGAVQVSNQGGVDVFVAKLNAAGTALIYATYLGGRGDDRAAGIAVNSAGEAYVTGATASTNFPLVAAARSTNLGGKEAFALKLNATGNTLIFSTFLGGANFDAGTAIAVDSAGNAYIAGDTQSADFFTSATAAQKIYGGAMDAFVTKLTSAGVISFSTFLGGAASEHAGGIAVDSSQNVYVAGGTLSTNFPVVSAVQASSGGSQDAFVTKIRTDGGAFLYSTYLGGSGGAQGNPEQANAIAVDAAGNAYVAGVTNSSNFPVTTGAFQTVFGGVQDAFVAKLNPAGSGLVYSSYLGGTSFDWGNAIAVDSGGNAFIAGYTSSASFPAVAPVQSSFRGLYDAFISKINAAGNALTFSTLYGGTGADTASALAIDPSGNMFVGGQTSSLDLTLNTPIQSNNTGGNTGWVLRLGVTAAPAQLPAANSVSPASGSGNAVTFTAQYSHPAGANALTTVGLLVNSNASVDFACYVTYTIATNLFKLANNVASSGSSTVIPGGGSSQNDQCALIGAGSGASLSGTNLTLTVALTFQPGFPGAKTVYLSAADVNVSTGWTARGAWTVTVPAPQPTADSVSPNSGSGSSQQFTFVFSDTQNPENLTGMAMLFSTTVTAVNVCYLVYDRLQGTVALAWDSGQGTDSRPIASSTVLQNSQCAIGPVTAVVSGLSIIIKANVTFKGTFSGLKNIYMFGSEGAVNTGWVIRGTFNTTAGGIPTADSVVPASGSGPAQRFSIQVSDLGGSSFITGVAVLFATSPSIVNACNIVYDRGTNTLSLAFDSGNGSTSIALGSANVASNSQCSLRGVNSTVVIGATSVVVTLDLTFSATFFGAKTVYLYAAEVGINTGYVARGSWTVTGGSPTADSVSPVSGSGSSASYVFTVSDSSAASNISSIAGLFTTGAPSNVANACYLLWDRNTATIGLYSDNGSTLSTKPIGSSNTLQNTQCAIGFSFVTTSGTSVLLNVNLVFKTPAFNGSKSVYLQAYEPFVSSGWVLRGSWTVQ